MANIEFFFWEQLTNFEFFPQPTEEFLDFCPWLTDESCDFFFCDWTTNFVIFSFYRLVNFAAFFGGLIRCGKYKFFQQLIGENHIFFFCYDQSTNFALFPQPIDEFCDFSPWLTNEFHDFFTRQIDEFHNILKWPTEEFHDFFPTTDWQNSLFFLTTWQFLKLFSLKPTNFAIFYFYQLANFVIFFFFFTTNWQNSWGFFCMADGQTSQIFPVVDWQIPRFFSPWKVGGFPDFSLTIYVQN